MTEDHDSSEQVKLTQGRSPAYPYISLEKALERAEKVYAAGVNQNSYSPGTFYKVWGIGAKSSGARQTMAALNHFGLVDYVGRGDDRKVRLSDLALKIIRDKRPDSIDRDKLIKEAALTPPIHGQLYEKFPPPMPDEVFIEHFLISDSGYNESAAKALIREYMGTVEFAKLLNTVGAAPAENSGASEDIDDSEGAKAIFKVGDFVSWESGGVIQWKEPWVIAGVDKDKSDKLYYKVEGRGEDTGESGWIPAAEAVAPEESNTLPLASFMPPPKSSSAKGYDPVPKGSREDKASLDEGEVVLRWPETLSAESVADFEYWMNGIIRRAKRRAGVTSKNEERWNA